MQTKDEMPAGIGMPQDVRDVLEENEYEYLVTRRSDDQPRLAEHYVRGSRRVVLAINTRDGKLIGLKYAKIVEGDCGPELELTED